MMNNAKAFILVLSGCFSLSVGPALAGPTSELYITFGGVDSVDGASTGLIAVAQGDGISRQWDVGSGEYTIAVSDTVNTMVFFNHPDAPYYGRGREYTLDGSATGRVSGLAPPGLAFGDGTTDGVFNYSAARGLPPIIQNTVYRFNEDWTSGVPVFEIDDLNGSAGPITYDPASNTLWIAEERNDAGVRVANYTLDGALLSSFRTESLVAYGLAMDPQDGTLWMTSYGNDDRIGTLFQFAQDGAVLEEIPHTGDGTGFFSNLQPADAEFLSMEFALNPGPTGPETDCTNGLDDDGDGLVDAADPDCPSPQPNHVSDLNVRCMHEPLYPQPGDEVTITARAIDSMGDIVVPDFAEIYVGTLETPAKVVNGQAAIYRFPAEDGQLSYGCRVGKDTLEATSWNAINEKLRSVDVGSLNNPAWKAVPVYYNGKVENKVDIVFFHDDDEYTAYDDPAFLADVHLLIEEGLFTIPWFVQYQWAFNFWVATASDANAGPPPGSTSSSDRCLRQPPATMNEDYAYRDAGAIIHKSACRDNAGGKAFTMEMDANRLQVIAHEMGHAPFGLADEYCSMRGGNLVCDGGYFSSEEASPNDYSPPHPNLYRTEDNCWTAAVHSPDFSPDDCRAITETDGDMGTWWIGEPEMRIGVPFLDQIRDLMQGTGGVAGSDGNLDRYKVGNSEVRRMNWLIFQCEYSGGC